MIEATVLKDSVTDAGERLTTVEATFHRFILPEINTHRSIAKSSASSRAIPVQKRLQAVKENPAMPVHWGANKAGMQADAQLEPWVIELAASEWRLARDNAVYSVEYLLDLGLHKQVANRLLEPFLWHTAIMTSTTNGWLNFFEQRCSPLAQPEMEAAAYAIKAAYEASTPVMRPDHLPYVADAELGEWGKFVAVPVSVARSARVSYRTFEGVEDLDADLALFDKLMEASPKHWAPTEHVAFDTRYFADSKRGPYDGWTPLRHSVFMPALLKERGIPYTPSR